MNTELLSIFRDISVSGSNALEASSHSPVPRDVLENEIAASVSVHGSAPALLETVNVVRTYLSKGRVRLEELVELIHRDQVLVARLVTATNRVAYNRGSPPRSIGEVVRRMGTRRLLTTIDELGAEQSLEKVRNANPAYAYAVHRGQAVREMAMLLHHTGDSPLDTDVLGVTLALWELPLLGLAWSFPALFGAIALESAAPTSEQVVGGSLGKVRDSLFEARCGLSRAALCFSTLQTLMLPEELRRFLSYCALGALKGSGPSTAEVVELRQLAGLCLGSTVLVDEYLRFSGRAGFEELIREWQTRLSLPGGSIMVSLARLEDILDARASLTGVSAIRIPSSRLFSRIVETERELPEDSPHAPSDEKLANDPKLLGALVTAFKRSSAAKLDPRTALEYQLWLTCYGLLHGVKFDRVAVLVLDAAREELRAGVLFGKRPSEIEAYRRKISQVAAGSSAELVACKNRKPIFGGKPLSPDGGQACAFPLIEAGEVHGVIYCERAGPAGVKPLGLDHKMAVTAFAECWRR